MGTGAQELQPTTAAVPGHYQDTRSEEEWPALKLAPICDAGTKGENSSLYSTISSPWFSGIK